MTVFRVGSSENGKFVPGPEGGILHRQGHDAQSFETKYEIIGKRITISLLGDGYIEAINPDDIEKNAIRQRSEHSGISGVVVHPPVLESGSGFGHEAVGRFGWKSQHSSLMSACADSLRNELGVRNRLYPEEFSTHLKQDDPTPWENDYIQAGQLSLDSLVEEVRHTAPPGRYKSGPASRNLRAGERIFSRIGCSVCHVPTYKTMPGGTVINWGTYKIPDFIGNTVIHPYSDFLLHDLGTGDGIPEAAKTDILDQSTANRFRTAPLWGLHFRSWLMHDGESNTSGNAIERHGGEASESRRRYERLQQVEKQRLEDFLDSL